MKIKADKSPEGRAFDRNVTDELLEQLRHEGVVTVTLEIYPDGQVGCRFEGPGQDDEYEIVGATVADALYSACCTVEAHRQAKD